ncbi:MAG TPA: thiamine diphosphokinase [Firmicutes bacterium]|nr:thiamine diphosphokinase [Candidatus Fermentithermobacillaceae bacterium]
MNILGVEIKKGFAAVVAGGETSGGEVNVLRSALKVIAADSGASFLRRCGIVPSVLVGDFDSCDPELVEDFRSRGVEVIELMRDKDKTDTEVALDLLLDEGFNTAVVLGALGGGRPEHALGNLFLIEKYSRCGMDVILWSERTRIFGILAPPGKSGGSAGRKFWGNPGDWVSLFPVTSRVEGVTTSGLKFGLSGATLSRGSTLGVSNEMVSEEASCSITGGFLLVVVTGKEFR